VNFYIQQHYL